MAKLTSSKQDYLEAIYDLMQKNGAVRSIDIANIFNFSRASVSRAISNLKKDGYILQEHYGTITLTEKGKCEAMSVRKRHDLIKYYLINILHISPDIAEEDACKMEHIISCETILEIEKAATAHINRQLN